MDNGDKFFSAVLGFLFAIPVAIWNAFVVHVLWGWFLVPLGIPALTILAAFGIRYAFHAGSIGDTESDQSLAMKLTLSAFHSLICLALGAIVHGVFG